VKKVSEANISRVKKITFYFSAMKFGSTIANMAA